MEDTGDRNPDMSHLAYGEGDPKLVDANSGMPYSKTDRSTETAKRWPELRSAQDFARDTHEGAKQAE